MYMYMYIYIGNKYEIKTWEHIGKIHPNINGDSIESWTIKGTNPNHWVAFLKIEPGNSELTPK